MRAPENAAGKHGACPHCKSVMEIPVLQLAGHLDDIRQGKCTVLVEQGTHHKTEDQILIRFNCRSCDKTLGIPLDKSHKKIQCTQCNTLLRLSLALVENSPEAIPQAAAPFPPTAGEAEPVELRIEFECSACKKPVKVPKKHGGKKGKCPHCQSKVDIPHYSTITRFRVPEQPQPSSTAITIGTGNDDLLKGYVPDNPLKAVAWSTAGLGSVAATTAVQARRQPDSRQRPKIAASQRVGLPWESAQRGESRLWATTKQLLLHPGQAFTNMFEDDGLGNPFGFAVVGHLLGTVYLAISTLPLIAIACLLASEHMPNGIDYTRLALWYGIGLGGWVATGAVCIPLLMFGGGAILHTGMLLTGGSNKPFSTTTRMIGYSLGSVAQLTFLTPLIAPIAMILLFFVQIGFAITRSHNKTAGQACGTLIIFILVPTIFIGLLVMAMK